MSHLERRFSQDERLFKLLPIHPAAIVVGKDLFEVFFGIGIEQREFEAVLTADRTVAVRSGAAFPSQDRGNVVHKSDLGVCDRERQR